ncbi:MAG: 50S ribosomal protein L23 [Lentisphaerae bacterium]|nr:MAG: 50S ribosomal protein L23 [Lentisphaerota bacterium]
MEIYDVIKTVRLSEKAELAQNQLKYTFEVAPKATKDDVKRAVEEIFQRNVAKVNILNRKGKLRRNRAARGYGRTAAKKIAIVTLAEGQESISFE